MSDLKWLEEAVGQPKEQRRALALAAKGKLTVWVKEWRVALPVPVDAEGAWEQLERELGLEPNPNATTAFASSLPAPDGHKTWLLVPPNACEELADEGTAEVRHLPYADDPEQLAVFSEPLILTISDLWIDPDEAGRLAPESPPPMPLQAYRQLIVDLLAEDWKEHEGWPRNLNRRIWKRLKTLKEEAPDHPLICRIDDDHVTFSDDAGGLVSIGWGDSWKQTLHNLRAKSGTCL